MAKMMTATAFLFLLGASAVAGQRDVAQVQTARPQSVATVAAVPFGPGEKVVYRVTWGILGKRGTATSEVTGIQNVRGARTYHLKFDVKGGVGPARVDDRQESWLDVNRLFSHRFKQDLDQPRYERLRTLDFFPGDMMWRRQEKPDSGALATTMPLDDVSFLYWSRTLPLEVGKSYEFKRYYKDEGNPVIVKVLRRERVRVPAGEFNTIVVKPLIRTSGLFSEGGEAEVYYTDDERRLIVLVKTKMSIGTMQLQLEKYTPGTILR